MRSRTEAPPLEVAPEVAAALAEGRPVVALESTLITHGLPFPHNLEAASRAEDAVRAGGAVPATVAIGGGAIRVGLDRGGLEELAQVVGAWKVTRQNMAAALGRGTWSGTTVSATMIAARMAGVEVFATGGIGGVHRGGERSMDISADLDELARTPVAVVCAGPKSILDVPRTLEVLETRGVPVVGWDTDELAGFFSVASGISLAQRVGSAREAADLVRRQRALGLASGILFCVPIPAQAALPREITELAIGQAEAEAAAAGVRGPRSTPWILSRVAELTEGRSVQANLALIENDARVGAELATALAAK
ncbi:MAG: pseudouridine-5'-phosphate glycosidase [Chloroflexi bacterium]|nr:pseudouridine-5'-phosphate glycosidase [Chloroflexota bacterium]